MEPTGGRRANPAGIALCLGLSLGVLPYAAPAQVAPDSGAAAVAFGPAPLLPVGHWAIRAADRAQASGLVRAHAFGQRALSRDWVAAVLQAAVASSASDPRLKELATGWWQRFVEEFPEYARPASAGDVELLGGSVELSAFDHRGRVRPGSGLFERRVDAYALPDRQGARVRASAAATAGPFYALVEPRAGDGIVLSRWDVGVSLSPVTLSVGREAVGYGPAEGGGIVLSGVVPQTRVQLRTDQPVRLPGFLRVLGSTSFHTSLARLEEARHPGHPWLWTARAAIQPHERFTVGVSRASIFGGDSVRTATNVQNVARMVLGLLSDDFENQVVALDGRWRLPTDAWTPITAYFEWGSDDAAGSWRSVPAYTFGASLPTLPGAPQLSAGIEGTRFFPFCCGNPPWYAHGSHPGGWVARDQPLGHPLGGEGWQVLGYSSADLLAARLRLDASAFVRERGVRGLDTQQRAANLFSPLRAGRSSGARLEVRLRAARSLEAGLEVGYEGGSGWRERSARVSAGYFF